MTHMHFGLRCENVRTYGTFYVQPQISDALSFGESCWSCAEQQRDGHPLAVPSIQGSYWRSGDDKDDLQRIGIDDDNPAIRQ